MRSVGLMIIYMYKTFDMSITINTSKRKYTTIRTFRHYKNPKRFSNFLKNGNLILFNSQTIKSS